MPIGMTIDSLTHAAKHLESSALRGVTDPLIEAVLRDQAKSLIGAVHLLAEAGERLGAIRRMLSVPMLADFANDPLAAIGLALERADQAQHAEDALCNLHAAVMTGQLAFADESEATNRAIAEALRAAAPIVKGAPAALLARAGNLTVN